MTRAARKPTHREDRPPIKDDDRPPRVRQRFGKREQRWVVWWEPETAIRGLGFERVDLDADRPTWSIREGKKLNEKVRRARMGDGLSAAAQSSSKTVSALIERYQASPRFKSRKAATQRGYRASLRRFEKRWGASPVRLINKAIAAEWYDGLFDQKSAHMAAHEARVASVLFSYGERIGWVEVNPFLRLDKVMGEPRDRVADWREFDALRDAAAELGRPGMRFAIGLATLNGQRQTDMLAAYIGDVDEEFVWRFERSKARRGSAQKLAAVPIHSELHGEVEARRAEADQDAPLIVDDVTGRRFKEHWFRHVFRQIVERAAKREPSVRDLQFRDLRRTFSTLSREGGASDRDRGDAMGNTIDRNPRLNRTYTPPSFEGASRAVNAIKRPEDES